MTTEKMMARKQAELGLDIIDYLFGDDSDIHNAFKELCYEHGIFNENEGIIEPKFIVDFIDDIPKAGQFGGYWGGLDNVNINPPEFIKGTKYEDMFKDSFQIDLPGMRPGEANLGKNHDDGSVTYTITSKDNKEYKAISNILDLAMSILGDTEPEVNVNEVPKDFDGDSVQCFSILPDDNPLARLGKSSKGPMFNVTGYIETIIKGTSALDIGRLNFIPNDTMGVLVINSRSKIFPSKEYRIILDGITDIPSLIANIESVSDMIGKYAYDLIRELLVGVDKKATGDKCHTINVTRLGLPTIIDKVNDAGIKRDLQNILEHDTLIDAAVNYAIGINNPLTVEINSEYMNDVYAPRDPEYTEDQVLMIHRNIERRREYKASMRDKDSKIDEQKWPDCRFTEEDSRHRTDDAYDHMIDLFETIPIKARALVNESELFYNAYPPKPDYTFERLDEHDSSTISTLSSYGNLMGDLEITSINYHLELKSIVTNILRGKVHPSNVLHVYIDKGNMVMVIYLNFGDKIVQISVKLDSVGLPYIACKSELHDTIIKKVIAELEA